MRHKEKIARVAFSGAAILTATVTLAVLGFMILLSMPVLKTGMLWEILTGPWSPDHGQFGILAMIVGTFYIASLSLFISFPISLGCSFFIQINSPLNALCKRLLNKSSAWAKLACACAFCASIA